MNLLADLDALADLLPDGIAVVDPEGRILWVNAHLCELLRYERDALLGAPIEVLVPDAVRDNHAGHRRGFGTSDVSRPMGSGMDLRARRADGSHVAVDISLRTTVLDGGPVVVAAVRDVSAQRALEQRNAFLDVVNDATRSAVFVFDATGVVAGCNAAAERLLGVDAPSIVGREVGETLLGASPELVSIVSSSLSGRTVENQRVVLTTMLGESLPVGVVSRPIRDRHRGIIGVSVLLFDLSEQEASQVSLLAAQERLDITERLGGLGAWEYDAATGELQMSPGLHALLGVSPLEHDGTIATLLDRIGPDGASALRERLAECLERGASFSMECALPGPGGELRWVSISGSQTTDALGVGRRHAHGIVQDLTAHHQLTVSLRRADQMKDEFLATVSHELRTPLTVIVGFADYLRNRADDDTATYFEAMHRNAREMDLMVDQLLDLSRVQSGRARYEPRRQSLRSLVDDVLDYAALPLAHHEVRNETSGVEVLVDPMGFRRILTNLLTNAAKFSEHGTEIVVTEELRPDAVVVAVSDHGVGIAPHELDQVFEQFVQAKEGRPMQVRGTGVGLAIAKRYVEMAQGRIWAESEVGVGSTFRFVLPRAETAEVRETPGEGTSA